MTKKISLALLLFSLAVVLGAGCAKKPAPEVVAPTEEAPVVSEMPSREISGIQEQAVSEAAVAEEGGVAGEDVAVAGLQRIFFDFDQYTLTPQARETLAANAAYLKANGDLRVRIEGHCDERGSDEYNLALGERRALAAKNYLVSLGVPADRLSLISYGEELPLDPGGSEEAWAKNRRAEFKIIR